MGSGGPILVGWDASEHALDALELGRVLAAMMDRELVPVAVAVDRLRLLNPTDRDAAAGRAREALGRMPAEAQAGAGRAVVAPSAGQGLYEVAEETAASAIVLGSTHRGPLGQIFLGTVAGDLLSGAPCPVAVAPRGYGDRDTGGALQVVGVAFDASDESRRAAAVAAGLARAAGAKLRVLAVLEPLPFRAAGGIGIMPSDVLALEERTLREALDRLVAELDAGVAAEGRILEGDPAAVLGAETQRIDLLVTGSRGYGPVGRTLLGSVSAALVQEARCPVLVVPRAAV